VPFLFRAHIPARHGWRKRQRSAQHWQFQQFLRLDRSKDIVRAVVKAAPKHLPFPQPGRKTNLAHANGAPCAWQILDPEEVAMLTLHSRTVGCCALTIVAVLWLGGDADAQTAEPPAAATPPAQSAQVQETAYTAAFDGWRAANDPRTAIVVVGRGGAPVFARAYNTDADGPSFIGSMSKAVTAACVATLIRDGNLSFATPMREALAGFFSSHGRPLDPRFEDVTIEQLLTHRSGLHDNGPGDPWSGILRERIAQHLMDAGSPQPLLVAYLSRNMLAAAPGGPFAYSNFGYLVLTAVIEERSGQPFEDYCRDKVFTPLGLTNARLNPEWRIFGGAAGWYMTGADYLRFFEIFDPAHPFLGDAVKSWIDAVRGRWGRTPNEWWYSLGVRTSAREGRWAVRHSGLLQSVGHDGQGRPVTAVINSLASRTPSGTGIFIAIRPQPGARGMDGKISDLHKEIARIAAAQQ
jgi:CubicO group peptidase (beta-lactamase class C family)